MWRDQEPTFFSLYYHQDNLLFLVQLSLFSALSQSLSLLCNTQVGDKTKIIVNPAYIFCNLHDLPRASDTLPVDKSVTASVNPEVMFISKSTSSDCL